MEEGDRGRYSTRREMQTVRRLLRSEEVDALWQELGVTAATLAPWRERFSGGRGRGDEEPAGAGGRGCAERCIRTFKEPVLWVRVFETVEELRLALVAFLDLYNRAWLIGPPGYASPAAGRVQLLGSSRVAA